MNKQIDIKPNAGLLGIQSGDVGLISGTSLLAQGIQLFEGCKWNHAFMFVWLGGNLYVYEAIEKGIETTLFADYIADKNIGLLVMKPKFNMPSENDLIKFCQPYVGHTNYDFFDLFILQPIRFITCGWLGGKPKPGTRKFTCGEWVMFVINHFNPAMFIDWNEKAPSDLFATSQGNGKLFEAFVYQ